MKLIEWQITHPTNPTEICAAPMNAQDAVNILIDEILGPDWCVFYSCNNEQANTEAVYAIVEKFEELRKPWYKKLFGFIKV